MKRIDPIGRSVSNAEISPRGCICNTTKNDKTKNRNVGGGGCLICASSCIGTANKKANSNKAANLNKY